MNEEPEEEEFKSLLHKKLHERNLSLQKDIHKKVTDNYTKVPQKLSDIRQNLTTSEANFQETLMALQQANHHCSETFWNMDDSINIANSITFSYLWSVTSDHSDDYSFKEESAKPQTIPEQ